MKDHEEEYIEQEENDEWDPAIGMREEDRKNKNNNNDLLILLSLILLFIIGVPSGLFLITRKKLIQKVRGLDLIALK